MNRFPKIIAIALILVPSIALGAFYDMPLQAAADMRYLGLIKVYRAELYSNQPLDKHNALDQDVSRCLTLKYLVSLSADDFRRGADAILSRQHSSEVLADIRNDVRTLHAAYQDVQKGDAYSLCYDADRRTTTLLLNQAELVSITSAEFAGIYFGIWLGPEAPIDEALRDKLLSPKTTTD